MTTASQIIKRACLLIGAIDVTETVGGSEAAECLDSLNGLIDSWSTMPQAAYNNQEIVVTMAPSTFGLTIGPGQQIDTTRPLRIESAYARYNNLDREIEVIEDKAEWDAILIKQLGTSWPEALWYDGGLPTGNVYFWPQPSGTVSLHLTVLNYVGDFADLTTDQVLSRGYKRALELNLAVELSDLFKLPVSASLQRRADLAFRAIRRVNANTPELEIGGRRASRLGKFLAGY
jgi:hypothetical protein